jgi:hypothetical protein
MGDCGRCKFLKRANKGLDFNKCLKAETPASSDDRLMRNAVFVSCADWEACDATITVEEQAQPFTSLDYAKIEESFYRVTVLQRDTAWSENKILREQLLIAKQTIENLITGNDIAHERSLDMGSWPDSALRKQACEIAEKIKVLAI